MGGKDGREKATNRSEARRRIASGRERIVLVAERPWGLTGEMLRGIYRYARPSRPWSFVHVLLHEQDVFQMTAAVRPDGAIARFEFRDEAKGMRRWRFPVVHVHGGRRGLGLPQVGVDDLAIGRMAAAHLADRGFEHFGCSDVHSRRDVPDRWLVLQRNFRTP